MSRRVISAVLTLKDQNFSSGLRRGSRNLSDFDRQTISFGNSIENMGKKAVSGFKTVSKAATGLAVGGVVALGAGVAKTMLDMDNSFATLQAQTGAMGKDLTTLKGAAKEAFSSGYGESLDEVSNAVARVKQNMHGIDNGDIASVTKNALLLANVFESDVNEVTRGANNLMDGFGITSQKAFDLFTAGGQRGVNFSNEMFDNMAEFAPLAKSMGFSAEEYFGILERGSESGVYNLSYVNDALKEFQIMTKDGSKRTSDAMGLMSKETQGVWKSFLKGNGTIKDVSTTIVGELKSMDDQVKAGQIGVELFGTKWEDLESEAMYAMLGSTDAMKGFEGATEAAAESVEGSIGNRMKSAWRDLQTSIAGAASDGTGKEFMETLASSVEKAVPHITSLADKAMEFGLVIKDNWTPIKETVIALGTGILATAVAFKALSIISTVTKALKGTSTVLGIAKVAMHAFNGVVRANPIGVAATAIGLLIAGGVLLYRNWDTVTAKTKEVWESIGGLEGALRIVTGPIGMVVGAAIDLAKNWDSTKSVWENVWGAMKRSAEETVNSVIGGINSMIETINKIPGVNIPIIAKVDWGESERTTKIFSPSKIDNSYGLNNAKTNKNFGIAEPEFNYAVGSNRITHDQVANIHKDEMIIPARQAEKVRQSGGNINNIDSLIGKPLQTVSNSTNNNNNIQSSAPVIQMTVHANQLTYDEVVNRLANDIELALSNM